jgi:hypothetical protein
MREIETRNGDSPHDIDGRPVNRRSTAALPIPLHEPWPPLRRGEPPPPHRCLSSPPSGAAATSSLLHPIFKTKPSATYMYARI